MKRSLFLASSLTALTGCGAAGNALNDSPVRNWLLAVEPLNHALIGTRGMAKLYPKSAIDWNFRLNGFDTPNSAAYQAMVHDDWSSYRLTVDGLVDHPQAFTVPQLRAMKSLTQITRHDCVEGWSVVGEWGGVPLGMLLGVVKPKPNARYVVFYSRDHDPNGTPYYESLSVVEAAHPQTLLALDLNGKPLD
ncbi:MAG: molybdopterin-dependent oxidoreductase, partial [Vulcanimicrobiaceae bacterium]